MAVDPKETNWCCRAGRAVGWVVQGLRDSPSRLKISGSATQQTASCKNDGPRRWFCSFLTHRQKRKPKIRKGPSEKEREASSRAAQAVSSPHFPLQNRELRDDAATASIDTRVSSLVIPS